MRPTLTREFAATPGFVVIANAGETNRLRAVEGVTCVYEDRAAPPLLQDSTSLVGADALWSQNVEGAGVSTTGDSTNADKETGEPNHTSAGGASVSWSWTATSSAGVTVNTFGSNFDTMLGVYTGSSVNGLSTVRQNDDAGGTLQSRVRFFPAPGQTYQIAVDGYNGATGDITLTISQ